MQAKLTLRRWGWALGCLGAVVGTGCGGAEPQGGVEAPIVGGTEADDRSYPWMVAVMFGDGAGGYYQGCGGSLIDERHVLTAGHCSVDFLYEPEKHAFRVVPIDPTTVRIAVRPQSLAALTPADLRVVRKVRVHPDFDNYSLDSDVAVWELERPIHLRRYAELAEGDEAERWIRQRRSVRAIGYGTIDPFTGETSDTLLEVDVPLVPLAECQANYQGTDLPITANMVCAGLPEGGRDSCWGDSGGPLFKSGREPQIVGVVSTGIGCAEPGFPGVYAKVSNFRSWIRQCRHGRCPTLTREQYACALGFEDCDGQTATGCETFVMGEAACGTCGAPACAAGEACGLDLETFAIACSAAQPLQPALACVDADPSGAETALFTAVSPNSVLQMILAGPENFFLGSSSAPTEVFFPGDNPSPATLDQAGPASWTLRGLTAEVGAAAPACAAPSSAEVRTRALRERVLRQRWSQR